MGNLMKQNGHLMKRDGHLQDSDDAECCCGDIECCDAFVLTPLESVTATLVGPDCAGDFEMPDSSGTVPACAFSGDPCSDLTAEGTAVYQGTDAGTLSCCPFMSFGTCLCCDQSEPGCDKFLLQVYVSDMMGPPQFFALTPISCSCDPLELVYEFELAASVDCAGGTITLTITETP